MSLTWLDLAHLLQGSEEWLSYKKRADFVTSTVAVELLGLGYSSARAAVDRRLHGILEKPEPSQWAMENILNPGHVHEATAKKWLCAKLNEEGVDFQLHDGVTLVHPQCAFLGATSDGYLELLKDGQLINLEVKAQGMHTNTVWDFETQVRPYYLLQCQLQMACLGGLAPYTLLIVWKGHPKDRQRVKWDIPRENHTRLFRVYFNEDLARYFCHEMGRVLRCIQEQRHPYPDEVMAMVARRHKARIKNEVVVQEVSSDFLVSFL